MSFALLCVPLHAVAAAACQDGALRSRPAAGLRVDNDVLGAQDQGYSNGILLRLTSADLADRYAAGTAERGADSGADRAAASGTPGCPWRAHHGRRR